MNHYYGCVVPSPRQVARKWTGNETVQALVVFEYCRSNRRIRRMTNLEEMLLFLRSAVSGTAIPQPAHGREYVDPVALELLREVVVGIARRVELHSGFVGGITWCILPRRV